MRHIYSSRQEVYERSGREESAKRVYATTHRRVIHVKLTSEMIPVKGVKNLTSGNTSPCTHQMHMPSASGITVKLVGLVSYSSKKSGFNPERKLRPGSTVMGGVEAIDRHLLKANSGDQQGQHC